ncbi:MAG: esterase [Verrucomicrobiaceae bacterium]|nr:esterase [Verrucomicrobiaceae bacterium]
MFTSSRSDVKCQIPSARILLLLLAGCFLDSCATDHRSYENERAAAAKKPGTAPEPGAAPMTVIEFDERGDFWKASQAEEAEKMIKAMRRPILITYVHGWRHDARPGDNDLKNFQHFLAELNKGLPNRVCGVYIGWRGASVNEAGLAGLFSEPAAIFSFWGRKKITDQMAGVSMSSTLWNLGETARTKGNGPGHCILIGHSFGGRIVEHTLGHAAIAQMHNNKPMPYDLTFLINPAAESLYARQLKQALSKWTAEQPAIVTITARNDGPNATAWPVALHLPDGVRSRNYELNGKVSKTESQRSYMTKTVGNDERQWTHEVDMEQEKAETASMKVTTQNAGAETSGNCFNVRLEGEKAGTVAKCKVVPLPPAPAGESPRSKAYWVVPVEKSILSGHGNGSAVNGIFSDSMTDLMIGIIMQVKAIQRTAPNVPLSSPGKTQNSDAPAGAISTPGLAIPILSNFKAN